MQLKQNKDFKIFLKYLIPSMLSMALMAVYTFTDTFVSAGNLVQLHLALWESAHPFLQSLTL